MSDDVLARIEAKVDALLRMVSDAPSAPRVAAPAHELVGPGTVTINGATIALLEPISARWKPSLTDQLLTRYGRQGADPSDAGPGQPRRSPAGFPLVYTPWGAKVLHNGQTFADDAAVEAWEEAVARQDAANATRDAADAAQVYEGRFKARSISDVEAGYIYAYTHTQAGTALAERIYRKAGLFSGTRTEINSLVSRGELAWIATQLNAHEAVAAWPASEVKTAVLTA